MNRIGKGKKDLQLFFKKVNLKKKKKYLLKLLLYKYKPNKDFCTLNFLLHEGNHFAVGDDFARQPTTLINKKI